MGTKFYPESAMLDMQRTLMAVVAAATGVGSGNRRVLYVPRTMAQDADRWELHQEVDLEHDCVKYKIVDKRLTVDAEGIVYAEPGTDTVVVNGR